jgi:hypothetical protein
MKFKVGLLFLSLAGVVGAQTVVPNTLANTDGNSVFTLLLEGGAANSRTYQTIISASQLVGLIDKDLSSLSWRVDAGGSNWPPAERTIDSFEIRIGQGVAPGAVNSTFANNFVGTPTLVRSGSLTFGVNDFATGAWGPDIEFDNPFHYTGGNLTVEYRFTGLPNGSGLPRFDAVEAGDPGIMNHYSSAWGYGWSDTALFHGHGGRVLVTQFSAAPVPEPATMAVLGIGALALVRKRRKATKA